MKFAASIIALLLAAPAMAVGTSCWTHTNEADFTSGTLQNLVATNLGELKLSRAIEPVLANDPKIAIVHALAEGPDGTIYVASGTDGALLAIKGGKCSTLASFGKDVNVTALLVEKDGAILAATSGEAGKVYRIKPNDNQGGKPVEIFAQEGVLYIWSLLKDETGTLFIATGPEGQLFSLDADGKSKLVVDTDQNNLLSLATDGKGTLYVGTDPNGIVYKVNAKTGELFVVYDALEPEINALVLDAKGTLYFAANDASANVVDPGAPVPATEIGRPESPTTAPAAGIHDEPPTQPKPSDPPASAPNDPPAIPRAAEPKHMMILEDEAAVAVTTAPAVEDTERALTPTMSPSGTGNGSAVYRVDPEGFVREIFRKPVVLYSMIDDHGKLLVSTGPGGIVYSIDQAAEETVAIATTDAKEVTALLAAADGSIYLGTATTGGVSKLSAGFAKEGTYTSTILDASQISRFGKLQLTGTLPAGTSLKISTRSSNIAAEDEAGWSPWTAASPATQFSAITSPSARFLQYRLSFVAGADASPAVSEVKIAFQQPNLAPVIKSLVATPKLTEAALAGSAEPHSAITIAWEAEDPNTDRIHYTLAMRSGKTGPWVTLKEKLTETTYEWENRSVADGAYQLRVIASDSAANAAGEGKTASRVSETVIVDNTPPQLGDLKTTIEGAGATAGVNIEVRAVDQTTTLANLEYSVDSSTDWQSVLPLDKIADSPDEAYRFTIPNVGGGAHQITLRAADARGNVGYQNVSVTVEAK